MKTAAIIIIAVICVAVVIGVFVGSKNGLTGSSTMDINKFKTVEKGDTISVEYIGKLTDGTVFDKSAGREPLTFTAGAGEMISGFDKAVLGMKLNEEKTITLSPKEAYGNSGPLAGKTLVFWIKVVDIKTA